MVPFRLPGTRQLEKRLTIVRIHLNGLLQLRYGLVGIAIVERGPGVIHQVHRGKMLRLRWCLRLGGFWYGWFFENIVWP
jgi:hypothetical protein